MRQLAVSAHFHKQLRRLPAPEQQRVVTCLKAFLAALQTGTIPAGYGLKKINGDKYEIRVDLKTRIVMKLDGNMFVCHVLGNHEDVRRYLRAYRRR